MLYNLKDLTFIIPLRIDTEERKENLLMVIEYLLNNYDTTIMVLEADIEEKVNLPEKVNKVFIKDNDPVFHHSRYRNYMIRKAITPFIALWDADALAPVDQVLEGQ